MQTAIKVMQIAIAEIKPYPNNARLNAATVKVLAQLIERVGFNVPLVVDKNKVIIKGHARWKAAQQVGLQTLPCIISENTDEENNQDRILDNKISELARWDNQKLVYEIESVEQELAEMGLDFQQLHVTIADVKPADIRRAEERQAFKDENKDPDGFMSVRCPNCGGEFQYEIKTY